MLSAHTIARLLRKSALYALLLLGLLTQVWVRGAGPLEREHNRFLQEKPTYRMWAEMSPAQRDKQIQMQEPIVHEIGILGVKTFLMLGGWLLLASVYLVGEDKNLLAVLKAICFLLFIPVSIAFVIGLVTFRTAIETWLASAVFGYQVKTSLAVISVMLLALGAGYYDFVRCRRCAAATGR